MACSECRGRCACGVVWGEDMIRPAHRLKYLCTTCCIAMSRPYRKDVDMKCGRCGSKLSYVHHKFRAPPKRDRKFWNVIRYLEQAGQIRTLDRGYIPKNMREAKELILKAITAERGYFSEWRRRQSEEKWYRARKIEHQRAQAIKKRRWERLAKYGKLK